MRNGIRGRARARHGVQGSVRQQPRVAVAEMQLAFGETGGVAEQAGHGVRLPCRILQALPKTM